MTCIDDLRALLIRLKTAQRDVLLQAARQKVMPSDGTLRKVSDLENTIGAVELLIEDELRTAKLPSVA